LLKQGLNTFAGKRVLLLQGPVGPFFWRLAKDLRAVGATVHKVNFHGGDWLFYPWGALNYRGRMQDWPDWLYGKLKELQIDVVVLFGDSRPIHYVAHMLAKDIGLEVCVFEEGYLRPNCITLERDGVNGHSKLMKSEIFDLDDLYKPPQIKPVPKPYWHMVLFGFAYFTAGAAARWWFKHYEHHQPLTFMHAWPWIRSLWRRHWYAWKQRGELHRLTTLWRRRYYLAPLQVFNDSQVLVHSGLGDVEGFLHMLMMSFAEHAPNGTLLVMKHHPMDRGYVNYAPMIGELEQALGLQGRVHYIHDQHLPTLIDHCKGVVVINSTVGLQALGHGAPVVALGKAIYNKPGLTYQGSLDDFWKDCHYHRPEHHKVQSFKNLLIYQTQANGSFYRRLPGVNNHTGVVWDRV
jgi:capsular polysaccharide export protein